MEEVTQAFVVFVLQVYVYKYTSYAFVSVSQVRNTVNLRNKITLSRSRLALISFKIRVSRLLFIVGQNLGFTSVSRATSQKCLYIVKDL